MKKFYKILGLGAGVLLLAVVGLVVKPHLPPTKSAQAQSDLSATSTVVFGLDVYGVAMKTTALPYAADPSTGPFIDDQGVAINPSDYESGVPHAIYLNASSFSVDFRVGMMICDDEGENCHTGWTPWASSVANGGYNNTYSPIVGGGPLDGGTVCGTNSATLHNRLGDIFIGAQTRPLPQGTVLNWVSLELYPLEYDFNVPVGNASNPYGPSVDPSCWNPFDDSVGTPGYTSGGWSNDAFDKWNNASTDGFVIGIEAGETSYNAKYVSDNIPATTTPGNVMTKGWDGNPLEITMQNTGTAFWPSEEQGQTGSPTGACTGSANGGSNNAPAWGDTTGSCTINYIYKGTLEALQHDTASPSGNFTPSPDPIQFTKTVPVTTVFVATTTIQIPVPCTDISESTNADPFALIQTANALAPGRCSGDDTRPEQIPAHYESSPQGSTVVLPGQNAEFIMNSLSAPSQTGNYVETWNMEESGNMFGTPANIPIGVVSGTSVKPTVTLSASSTDIALGSPTNLTITTTNVTSCTGSGTDDGNWNGAQPTGGVVPETPQTAGTATFTITCTGPSGSGTATATASATVTVHPSTPTLTFTASPLTITLGNSTGLTWTTTNVTSCTASGSDDGDWNGNPGTSGTAVPEQPGAVGTATFNITCTGSGGTVNGTASVVVQKPTADTGIITMSSENSVIPNVGVPASWDIINGASDVCDGASCQGYTGTYSDEPAVGDPGVPDAGSVSVPVSSVTLSDTNHGYAFNSIQLAPAGKVHVGVIDEVLTLTRNMLISTAEAWAPAANNPLAQTLNPGKTVAFIILWNPIANMSVSPATLSLNAKVGASANGQITVSNTGAPGSTLTWTSSVAYTNGAGWLSVAPSTDSSGLTNGASGNSSENVALNADASGLSVGTYTATVNLVGTSAPGPTVLALRSAVTVTFTVTNGSGGGPYYLCANPSGPSCTTTTTPGYISCIAACNGAGSTVTKVTVNCHPSTVATNGASACTATVQGTGSYSQGVHWSANNGSVDQSGNYTAPASVLPVTVTACSTQSGYTNVCGSTPITVVPGGSPQSPTCTSFTANPSAIIVPESSSLQYACSPVGTTCGITGGGTNYSGGATGSVSVSPTSTTMYTLTCVNGGSSPTTTSTLVTVGGSSLCEQNPNAAGCPGQ